MSFNVSPSVDSGHITCGTKDVATNQYIKHETFTQCIAIPNSGFQFSRWIENMAHNSTKTISSSTLSKSPINSLLASFGFEPKDNGTILDVSQFGYFTANFKQLPPPIPPRILDSIVWCYCKFNSWLVYTKNYWMDKSKKTRQINKPILSKNQLFVQQPQIR